MPLFKKKKKETKPQTDQPQGLQIPQLPNVPQIRIIYEEKDRVVESAGKIIGFEKPRIEACFDEEDNCN